MYHRSTQRTEARATGASGLWVALGRAAEPVSPWAMVQGANEATEANARLRRVGSFAALSRAVEDPDQLSIQALKVTIQESAKQDFVFTR